MNRGAMRVFVVLALAVLGAGCHAKLDANWDGEIDCGANGTFDISVDLEFDEKNTFVGDGEYDSICTDGVSNFDCSIEFELTVEAEKSMGAQDLDVELDNCVIVVGGETFDVDCDEPDDVEWDGKDEIVGEIAGCDLTLER